MSFVVHESNSSYFEVSSTCTGLERTIKTTRIQRRHVEYIPHREIDNSEPWTVEE